jgi:hypothetical protein
MPCAFRSTGSCGGIALALDTSRKKTSIWPAGVKEMRIRPHHVTADAVPPPKEPVAPTRAYFGNAKAT